MNNRLHLIQALIKLVSIQQKLMKKKQQKNQELEKLV